MSKLKIILMTFISSIVITGISFLDGKLWDILFVAIGLIAYFLTGFLYKYGLISDKKSGSEANKTFFVLLLVAALFVCFALVKLKSWIDSWPIAVKISIISVLSIGAIVTFVLTLYKECFKKQRNKNK